MNAYPIHCAAYGLAISTDRTIPGLPALARSTDGPHLRILFEQNAPIGVPSVEIRLPPGDTRLPAADLPQLSGPADVNLAIVYEDGVRFDIDGAAQNIWCNWPASSTIEDVATYLLGPILALVLRLRGTVCLHASAAMIDGRAVLFVGPAGSGKSTTAAALAEAGYTVIADDVGALDEGDAAFTVRPAYPLLRLWPDSVAALYGGADAMPLLTPNWDKRRVDLPAFPKQPVLLAAIYMLADRSSSETARSTPVPAGSQALLELIGNSYPATILDHRLRAGELAILGRLVEMIPIYHLSLPNAVNQIAHALPSQLLKDLSA